MSEKKVIDIKEINFDNSKVNRGFLDKFINQYQLIKLMNENGFENCKYRDLSGGIVSIHSGWKV